MTDAPPIYSSVVVDDTKAAITAICSRRGVNCTIEQKVRSGGDLRARGRQLQLTCMPTPARGWGAAVCTAAGEDA